MPETEERLRRIEERLDALERRLAGGEPAAAAGDSVVQSTGVAPAEARAVAAIDEGDDFDLALLGRTLIVLGGAYLLRAITENGFLPVPVALILGLLYAVSWSLLSLRSSVPRTSAGYHGAATAFTSLPLIFEAVRKFNVFGDWSSALALTAVTAVVFAMTWRRNLQGVTWLFVLMVLGIVPLLMAQTESMIPFTLYLTAVGVTTVWLGYLLEWRLLRWFVAGELNLVLLLLGFFVATHRLPAATPAAAIATSGIAFAAYLATFAVRTLVRQREVIAFEITQTLGVLVAGVGAAMWIAASTSTLEVPIALAMFALAAASYAVSFAFMLTPRNFVFYSSLALMLIVAGGGFISRSSVLWTVLALASGYVAVRARKSSLALHAAVYLFSGFVGAGILPLGLDAMVFKIGNPLALPSGAILLLVACIAAASIPAIERQGTFHLWTAAKAAILAELGWIAAAVFLASIIREANPDAAVVAVVRTAVLATLTVLSAWASRFTALSPARLLCNPLMIALALKLMWEDFRVGRATTLFVSLAIVGIALIITPRLRRKASPPQPAELAPAMA